jgi:DNA-binding NarL/FixJ family response regulator
LRYGGIIIGSSAAFLADSLKEKLSNVFSRDITVTDNEDDLLKRIQNTYPRLILLEHCLSGHTTDEFISWITKKYRDLHIAVWAAADVAPSVAARYIYAGAESFFSLRDSEDHLQEIIRKILSGCHYYPSEVEALIDKSNDLPVFGTKPTEREREIIRCTIDGKSNQEIAKVLGVQVCTVKMHKAHLYRKCQGNTAIHLLKYGLVQGIISPEELGTGKGVIA